MHIKLLSRKAKTNYRRKSIRSKKQKGGDMITLKLFNHLDEESSVKISSDATVLELKQKIAEEQNINNIDDIQLFLDNELKDKYLLKKYVMSANLIIEVSRIKEMMGINETQPKNGLLLVESRGSFTKSLWKEILELGEKYESKDAAQRWTSVRQRLLNMMEENGSFTQMDRITKINRFMKELEQSASTKSVL